MLAVVTTTLRHEVRLVHAGTGRAVRGLRSALEPHPFGWSVRTTPEGVTVVAVRDDAPAPDADPVLVLTVVDGRTADLLVLPAVPGRPPRTVVVPLTAPVSDVTVQPAPQTLTVVLTTLGDGDPAAGRTVVARASAGTTPRPTIALPETVPGQYASAPVAWSADFRPADLLVDGALLRQVSLDPTTAATRVHLVDTT